MLTTELVDSVRVFESLPHFVVEPPTSQHEEQNHTQLEGKGHRNQQNDDGGYC